MDRRITIDAPTVVVGEGGGTAPSWAELATVWAEVKPLLAKERNAAPQTMPEMQAAFTIRWRSDVTSEMSIQHDGRRWQIQGIAEIGRREGLQITAAMVEAGA